MSGRSVEVEVALEAEGEGGCRVTIGLLSQLGAHSGHAVARTLVELWPIDSRLHSDPSRVHQRLVAGTQMCTVDAVAVYRIRR